jgi:hypothetical protein
VRDYSASSTDFLLGDFFDGTTATADTASKSVAVVLLLISHRVAMLVLLR